MQGQRQVGLLNDVLPVEVEVGEVKQKRILVGARVREVLHLVRAHARDYSLETAVLRRHAEPIG